MSMNSIYLVNIWADSNTQYLIDLMFDAMLAIADRYERRKDTNILSVRVEHANLLRKYSYCDNLGLYKDEVLMPRHLNFAENSLSRAIKISEYNN